MCLSPVSPESAEIEAQLGLELARELLHARIARKARHVHELDAAIARRQQRALEQRRADAVALPRLLDAEGDLGHARKSRAQRLELGDAAQDSIDQEPVHHGP